jgi:putative endopeptidase
MQLRENTLPQLRGIIEKSPRPIAAKGTDAQRIGDFYASFMDEARLEQLGARR